MLVLKKIVHKPGHFRVHHSVWEEIIFLSMGEKQELPHFLNYF